MTTDKTYVRFILRFLFIKFLNYQTHKLCIKSAAYIGIVQSQTLRQAFKSKAPLRVQFSPTFLGGGGGKGLKPKLLLSFTKKKGGGEGGVYRESAKVWLFWFDIMPYQQIHLEYLQIFWKYHTFLLFGFFEKIINEFTN